MKIGEVLELTKTMNIATIAKQIDGISEKPLRAILHEVGAVHQNGKKGWNYEKVDPEILGRSLFDFVQPKAHKSKNASNNAITNTNKSDNIKIVDSNSKTKSKGESDIKAEIQALITGKQASKPEKTYKGIYFDNDIANFLDNIQHGNKSELVNKIIRQYLIENDLI